MKGSALEALLAELLGDVGKLHDEIKSLPSSIYPTIGAIIKASKESKIMMDQYAEHQKNVISSHAETEKKALQKCLSEEIRKGFKKTHPNKTSKNWPIFFAGFLVGTLLAIAFIAINTYLN